jgi:hypothetical protein
MKPFDVNVEKVCPHCIPITALRYKEPYQAGISKWGYYDPQIHLILGQHHETIGQRGDRW